MKRVKKRWGAVALVAAALILLVLILYVKKAQMQQNHMLHKSITGTVLSYEQTSEGMTVVVDDDATSSDKVILIIEDTMFTDDLLKQSIFDMKTGLYITVESEFWTQTYDDVYPAILISPAT